MVGKPGGRQPLDGITKRSGYTWPRSDGREYAFEVRSMKAKVVRIVAAAGSLAMMIVTSSAGFKVG